MHVVEGMSARDFPPPPTFEQIAGRFAGPIFALVPQPTLSEAGWGTQGSNGGLDEVSASYSVFRNPGNLEDPANFVDDVDDILVHLRAAEKSDQPDWFVSGVRNARYPMVSEAVRTVLLADRPDRSISDLLAHHLNHVLINSVPARRHGGWHQPPELTRPVTASDAHDAIVSVDGVDLDGLVIDGDADAIGWAVELGDRAVSLVLVREFLPHIDPRLVTQRGWRLQSTERN